MDKNHHASNIYYIDAAKIGGGVIKMTAAHKADQPYKSQEISKGARTSNKRASTRIIVN